MFAYQGPAEAVAFSPDNRWLAVANREKGISVWEMATGKLRLKLEHSAQVSALTFDNLFDFHFDTHLLAFVGQDNKTIELWDVISGNQLHTFHGHTAEVYAVAFNIVSNRIVSVSRDGTLKVWDVETGRELHSAQVGMMEAAAFSPNGRWLATKAPTDSPGIFPQHEEIKLWDMEDSRLLRTLPAGTDLGVMAFSPDGKWLADAGSDWDSVNKTEKNGIRIYDTSTGHALLDIPYDKNFRPASLSFGFDGRWLAVGQPGVDLAEDVDLWEVQTGRQLLHFMSDGSGSKFVAFSNDGEWLAYTESDYVKEEKIRLSHVGVRRKLPEGGTELAIRETDPNKIVSLSLAEDGSKIASGDLEGMVRVWDSASGHVLYTLPERAETPVFSPDGKVLATFPGKIDQAAGIVIKLWDAETGKELRAFDVSEVEGLISLVFSPDGRWLALGGFCKVMVLDVATGKQRHTLVVTPDPTEKLRKENALVDLVLLGYLITNLAFSPDGQRLAVVPTTPNSLQLWDTSTGQKVNEIVAGPDEIEHPMSAKRFGLTSFNPDGRSLVVSDYSRGDPEGGWLVTYDASTLHERGRVRKSGMVRRMVPGAGKQFFTMTHDMELDISDITSGKLIRTVHLDSAGELTISSNGRWLAVASPFRPEREGEGSNSIDLWDLSTDQRQLVMEGLPGRWLHSDQAPLIAAVPESSLTQQSAPTSMLVSGSQSVQQQKANCLPAPRLLSPRDGEVFEHYPRHTTLVWAPVPLAVGYMVEWDYKHEKGWQSEYRGSPSPVYHTSEPTYSFDFVGAQPGRWRVWAVDTRGNPGTKSEWREFSYTH